MREEESSIAGCQSRLMLWCAVAACVALVSMASANGQQSDKPDASGGQSTQVTPPAPSPVIGAGQPAVTTQPSGAGAEKGADKAGCGKKGSKQDLTPPPLDQPQPKFVCAQATATVDPVWQGLPIKFEYVISNGGEGPLRIELRAG